MYVTMTCLNGYFHDPALESLAQALTDAEGGGAVAVWAPSGMTEAGGQAIMNQELFRWLFTESDLDWCTADLGRGRNARQGAVTDDDIRRTWILLGDPTMKLRVPVIALSVHRPEHRSKDCCGITERCK